MEQVAANGFVYTGVAATEDEERSMRERPPVIVVGGWVPEGPAEVMHRCTMAHGLPDIRGSYGYDFAKHEFIRLPGSLDAPTDTFPSRRLADIVGR